MAKQKGLGLLSMCERVSKPDMQKLAELTERAKGNRTAKEFAAVCNVSASTISRLLNAKFEQTVADDIIAAIAVNSADQSIGIKEFLDAQGLVYPIPENTSEEAAKQIYQDFMLYVADGYRQALSHRSRIKMAQLKKQQEHIIQEIILEDIKNRRYQASVSADVEAIETYEFSYIASFILDTDALQTESLHRWAFTVSNERGPRFVSEIDSIAKCAYFGRPAEHGTRVSLITTDKNTFYQAKWILEGCNPVYDSISIILINVDTRTVDAEYILPRNTVIAQVFPAGENPNSQDIYGIPDEV